VKTNPLHFERIDSEDAENVLAFQRNGRADRRRLNFSAVPVDHRNGVAERGFWLESCSTPDAVQFGGSAAEGISRVGNPACQRLHGLPGHSLTVDLPLAVQCTGLRDNPANEQHPEPQAIPREPCRAMINFRARYSSLCEKPDAGLTSLLAGLRFFCEWMPVEATLKKYILVVGQHQDSILAAVQA